ncbi:unnamed protein product, partial [Mesorhabditis spiculigera]
MERINRGIGSSPGSNSLVSRILQVALGLFVTTQDIPPLSDNHRLLPYDCAFDTDCRWQSVGGFVDKWRIARGEPDSLLWLAATGTMQLPIEPFVLVEQRGQKVDSLMSDEIECQNGTANFAFNYWAIGNADLEICLTHLDGTKFNCTGWLNTPVMPGKVSLKIPSMQSPFKIEISPNGQTGILAIDDIKYDAAPSTTYTTAATSEPPEKSTAVPAQTTEKPFELLIIGNKTEPLFDRRIGVIINDSAKLLCDFNEEFACQWGAEAGKWAIVRAGAIPSLEEAIPTGANGPSFPAALVLQGSAMLTSDPIRCQSGPGKLLFRYWSNGDVLLQACALGYGVDSNRIDCVDQSTKTGIDPTLAVFDFPKSIKEPFTMNLVPQWPRGVQNKYLIIDEIAYIGDCVPPSITKATILLPTGVIMPHEKPIPEAARKTLRPVDYEEFTELPTTNSASASTYRPRSTKYTRPAPDRRTFPWRTTTIRPVVRPDEYIEIPSGMPAGNYCSLLNCNFDENACNYLNHGLTKVPWTLRNRGYGFPLSASTDIRPTHSNGQFVSAVLFPGDIAILESPRFNATRSLNVLLFQYFRPSHMSTIRLCLGSSYTGVMRTASAFLQCPSILRSVTARNAQRWNTVHVQIPPGTTNFFLVAQNSGRAEGRAAIGIDNMRMAICDARHLAASELHEMFDPYDMDID